MLRRPGLRFLIILCLLLAGFWAMASFYGSLLRFGGRGDTTVPNLVGETIPRAEKILNEKSLTYSVARSESSETVPSNTIISQEPDPGMQVKKGRPVFVVVSTGPEIVAVPDLQGLDYQTAAVQLGNQKLKIGKTTYKPHPVATKNVVIEQEPPAGKNVPAQTPIDLVLSLGPPPVVVMPGVVGYDLIQTKSTLQDSKLQLGEIGWKLDSSPPGKVLTQNPKPGEKVHEGDLVSLVVSAGSAEKAPPFKQSWISITLPAFQGQKEINVWVTDAASTNLAYRGLHQGKETIQLMVSGYGNSKVEVYLENQLLSSGSL